MTPLIPIVCPPLSFLTSLPRVSLNISQETISYFIFHIENTMTMQLIQIMKLTYLIAENEPTKSSCSIQKTVEKVIATEKNAEDDGNTD